MVRMYHLGWGGVGIKSGPWRFDCWEWWDCNSSTM